MLICCISSHSIKQTRGRLLNCQLCLIASFFFYTKTLEAFNVRNSWTSFHDLLLCWRFLFLFFLMWCFSHPLRVIELLTEPLSSYWILSLNRSPWCGPDPDPQSSDWYSNTDVLPGYILFLLLIYCSWQPQCDVTSWSHVVLVFCPGVLW